MPATKYVAGFEYTDAELLALWRECLARISVSGQEYQMDLPGGGTQRYTAADIAEMSDAKFAALKKKHPEVVERILREND